MAGYVDMEMDGSDSDATISPNSDSEESSEESYEEGGGFPRSTGSVKGINARINDPLPKLDPLKVSSIKLDSEFNLNFPRKGLTFNTNLTNTTKSSVTIFEEFVSDEWPSSDGKKALKVLRFQLKHCGGFSEEMDVLNLSTPSHVQLDVDQILALLRDKTKRSPIKQLTKFILPNVVEIKSGDEVKNLLENFCGALGGHTKVTMINTLSIHYDQISTKFAAENLEWIEDLYSRYQIDEINIHIRSIQKPNKKFYQFRLKLCRGSKKQNKSCRGSLKRRAPQNGKDVANKRRRMGSANLSTDMIDDDYGQLLNDGILQECWNINKLHKKKISGEGVTIAVISSGINIAHKAFLTRIVAVNDITCDGTIDLTTDRIGDGTMCAAIACGGSFTWYRNECLSSKVPAGVAPKSKIVVYKVTNRSGEADADMIAEALDKCFDYKDLYQIDIVLLLHGSKYQNFKQDQAIHKLVNAGVLVVTGAGNSGHRENIAYPAASGNTICVGAHDIYCCTSNSTTKGRELDFTAPGVGLVGASSSHPTAIGVGDGTSYAAASVAGLLALVIQFIRMCSDKDLKKLGVLNIQPSLEEVLHNQVAMKRLLQRYSKYPTHTEEHGYGYIDTTKLFSDRKNLVKVLYEQISTHI